LMLERSRSPLPVLTSPLVPSRMEVMVKVPAWTWMKGAAGLRSGTSVMVSPLMMKSALFWTMPAQSTGVNTVTVLPVLS